MLESVMVASSLGQSMGAGDQLQGTCGNYDLTVMVVTWSCACQNSLNYMLKRCILFYVTSTVIKITCGTDDTLLYDVTVTERHYHNETMVMS